MTRLCGCTVDAELGAGPVCPACGHRDHGRSGCGQAMTDNQEAVLVLRELIHDGATVDFSIGVCAGILDLAQKRGYTLVRKDEIDVRHDFRRLSRWQSRKLDAAVREIERLRSALERLRKAAEQIAVIGGNSQIRGTEAADDKRRRWYEAAVEWSEADRQARQALANSEPKS